MERSDLKVFFSLISDRFRHYALKDEIKLLVRKDGFYIRFHFANTARNISCFEQREDRAWRKEFKQRIEAMFGVKESVMYLNGRTQICYEIPIDEIDRKIGIRFSLYRDNSDLL